MASMQQDIVTVGLTCTPPTHATFEVIACRPDDSPRAWNKPDERNSKRTIDHGSRHLGHGRLTMAHNGNPHSSQLGQIQSLKGTPLQCHHG
jgi:hypothetical protein